MAGKSKFREGVDRLGETAKRINNGLEAVVEMLGDIADGAEPFLSDRKLAGKKGDAVKRDSLDQSAETLEKLRAIVGSIQQEVGHFNDLASTFSSTLEESGREIDRLNKTLEEAKRDALVDPLTGVANRRRFEQVLGKLVADIDDLDGQLSILLADVDLFKEVNDNFGHRIGDEVLRLVAKAFLSNLKGHDTVSRWGGDEFAVILPETKPKDAITVADHIRNALAARPVKNTRTGQKIGKVTLSIGVAGYKKGDDVDSLLHRADQGLYEAKESGRNKVVFCQK